MEDQNKLKQRLGEIRLESNVIIQRIQVIQKDITAKLLRMKALQKESIELGKKHDILMDEGDEMEKRYLKMIRQ